MHPSLKQNNRSQCGMTLMEMIVAVALLVLIVTSLLGAFNQTSRAFKTGFNQTDVLEAGRATTEMVTRVLTDLSPSGIGNTNPSAFSLLSPLQSASGGVLLTNLSTASPRQRLFMQKLMVLHKTPDEWVRSAFLVGHVDTNLVSLWNSPQDVLVGSLYRYQRSVRATVTNRETLWHTQADILLEPSKFDIGNLDPRFYSRVVEGVVHFSVRTSNIGAEYVDSGRITNRLVEAATGLYRRLPSYEPLGIWFRSQDPDTGAETDRYTGSMLPSYVEFEIGLLEHEAMGQVRALLADKVATADFLQRNAHRIHFFRQRVPIRLGVSL